MKTDIASAYRKIKQMRSYSPDLIYNWQLEHLRLLITHAYANTRYYNRLFKTIGLHPSDIRTISDLKKIPSLTKEIIRENFYDIIPNNIESIPHKKSATGGSTGDPLIYWLDNRSWSICNANKIVSWEKVGYNYGDPFIALGSTSLFVDRKPSLKHQIYYRLKNKIGLNGITMSDEICNDYISLIKKKKIRFIYGYASSIYLLARYSQTHDQYLNITACFPTSEVLKDRFRKTIKDGFKCAIMDCYGANDGGITAFSLENNPYEVGYNCLVNVDKSNQDGVGAALLTDLFNYAMPLINYKLGDEIKIDPANESRYSYNGQIIYKVVGRTSDIIQLENGRELTGPGFTILFKDLPVEHYCIKKVGLNSIKCTVVKLSDFGQTHEDIIKSSFKKQMGENSNFEIEYTNQIPLSKSGKREYFKTCHSH